MSRMSKKHKKLKITLAISIVVVIMAGLAFYGYKYVRSKNREDQPVSEEAKRQSEAEDVKRAKGPENKNYNQDNTQTQNAQNRDITVVITSADQSGQTIFVSATVDGATSGNCQLRLVKGDKKIEKTATIGLQVSYYICRGFNIDISEFQEKGEWEATVEVSTPNGSGKSDLRRINIQ